MVINKGNGLIYEYVTRNNRWIRPSSEFIEHFVNKFIAQDIGQNYMFTITYTENALTCDATICVYRPDVTLGVMIPLGCGSVLNTKLSDYVGVCPAIEPTPIEQEHYYVDGYYVPNYYV